MRATKALQYYWQNHQIEELMLCTITGKQGSGYRGTGAKKIIRRNGESCGYLSGGCLEGDIIETGLKRWNDAPFTASFSTMSEEDRLMGYQTGCAGIIDVLFERLPPDTGRMPEYLPYGAECGIASIAVSLKPDTLGQRSIVHNGQPVPEGTFADHWITPFELYVIGCGPNTRVFAELAPALGWNVTFLDYRKGNSIPEQTGIASRIHKVDEIGDEVKQGPRSAVILSTHNYEADLNIMAQLQGRDFFYFGCIGPRRRFDQMREDLRKFRNIEMNAEWANKVRAPAGLMQGRSPENIAFAITAEIQQALLA